MNVARVNGEPVELGPGLTVALLVAGRTESPRGVAVARNGELVPRSRWEQERIRPGDEIELLTAAQGG